MKILIGVPSYDGRVHTSHVYSLLRIVRDAVQIGIEVSIEYVNGLIIDRARDEIATKALQSDCTHLLFLDGDVAFPSDVFAHLISRAHLDIVAAIYPGRGLEPAQYPVRKMEDPGVEDGAIEVECVPMGCTLIRRNVLETLAKDSFDYTLSGELVKRLFESERIGEALYTEDYAFCKRSRDKGFSVWAIPGLTLVHEGIHTYVGSWRP